MQASAAGEWEISWRAMTFPIKSLLQGTPQLQGCRGVTLLWAQWLLLLLAARGT